MKQNLVKTLTQGLGLALGVSCMVAAGISDADATETFTWVPDAQNSGVTSGTLKYDPTTGLVSSINWTASYWGSTYTDNAPTDSAGGNQLTGTVLADGNLFLQGDSSGDLSTDSWNPWNTTPPATASTTENFVAPGFEDGPSFQGDWVQSQATSPVPEPATWISGALLALPFGFGVARKLRRRAGQR